MNLNQANITEIQKLQAQLQAELNRQTANRPTLNLTRGKPSTETAELEQSAR